MINKLKYSFNRKYFTNKNLLIFLLGYLVKCLLKYFIKKRKYFNEKYVIYNRLYNYIK